MVGKKGSLIWCGSVGFDVMGRTKVRDPELEFPSPMRYGPAAYIDVAQVFTSSTSCHAVLIDTSGVAYTLGRNGTFHPSKCILNALFALI